jgi:hypothetical protein
VPLSQRATHHLISHEANPTQAIQSPAPKDSISQSIGSVKPPDSELKFKKVDKYFYSSITG